MTSVLTHEVGIAAAFLRIDVHSLSHQWSATDEVTVLTIWHERLERPPQLITA